MSVYPPKAPDGNSPPLPSLPTDYAQAGAQTSRPKRSGLLTAFLILLFVANGATALTYLLGGATIQRLLPNLPTWGPYTLGALALANVAAAFGIWNWQRWGAYLFAATALAALIIQVMYLGAQSAIFGLVSVGILAFLLKDVWKHMK